ncbi:MAG: hypothetical protein WC044_03800 [Crocinitomicaceae bacterium]
MKVCILEICEKEPSKHHVELFANSDHDFFYVSYLEEGEDCIAFNKKKSWAFNRNCLFEHVKGKYDYYLFIDFDILLSSKNGMNPLDEMIAKLTQYQPAMYRPSGFRDEMKNIQGISVGGFINHSVTVLPNKVALELFPLPESYGGFWDAASFINTLLVPAYEKGIMVDYEIVAHNTQSSNYKQNLIPFIGARAMKKLFKDTRRYYTNSVPDLKDLDEFKSYYQNRIQELSEPTLNFDFNSVDMNAYANLSEIKKNIK